MVSTAVVGADTIPFFDASNADEPEFRSWTNIISDLTILTDSTFSNGILVKTGAGIYAARTIVASAVNNELGIAVTNGNGIAGNPTIGVDIVGQTLETTIDGPNDFVLLYDASADKNVKVRASDLASVGGAVTTAFVTMTDGSNNAVADSATDTFTFTGGEGVDFVISDIANNATVTGNLDVNGLTIENTLDETNDFIVFFDASAGVHRKTAITNVAGAGGTVGQDETTATGGANEAFAAFFTNTPLNDDAINVFFNGIKLRTSGWSRTGTTLTLIDVVNGYSTESGDIIAADYEF